MLVSKNTFTFKYQKVSNKHWFFSRMFAFKVRCQHMINKWHLQLRWTHMYLLKYVVLLLQQLHYATLNNISCTMYMSSLISLIRTTRDKKVTNKNLIVKLYRENSKKYFFFPKYFFLLHFVLYIEKKKKTKTKNS